MAERAAVVKRLTLPRLAAVDCLISYSLGVVAAGRVATAAATDTTIAVVAGSAIMAVLVVACMGITR